MFTKMFAGSLLALGLLVARVAVSDDKPKDCCAANLACCKDKNACCEPKTRLGCCEKGLKCCAENKGCCAVVQKPGTEGSASDHHEAKACCGPSKTAAKLSSCCAAKMAASKADCCTMKLACCSDQTACCVAEAKTDCCENGLKCCMRKRIVAPLSRSAAPQERPVAMLRRRAAVPMPRNRPNLNRFQLHLVN